jgi:hypothetical protein
MRAAQVFCCERRQRPDVSKPPDVEIVGMPIICRRVVAPDSGEGGVHVSEQMCVALLEEGARAGEVPMRLVNALIHRTELGGILMTSAHKPGVAQHAGAAGGSHIIGVCARSIPLFSRDVAEPEQRPRLPLQVLELGIKVETLSIEIPGFGRDAQRECEVTEVTQTAGSISLGV